MRIRNIFVASLLTMTLGCPGDDTGETDTNATVTTTETPGTTTTEPGTSSGEPGTSSGEPGTSSGEPGTSSGEPPADSGSSGSDSGSSSGGMVNAACEQFCTDYFSACGASEANDYGDPAGCEATCAGYDQETLDCKVYHASMADGPDSVHCGHANVDGGGVC